jgi:hypothetical protein
MFVYGLEPRDTDYEEHSEIEASWMRGLILGLLIGMFLIFAGVVLRLAPNGEELSRDCLISGIPVFVICLVILTIWKRYSDNRQSN